MTLTHALLVALGGALGAPLRYGVNHVVRERFGTTPPVGTLAVNVSGSLVLGLLVGAGVGFCGALTTFSTLALELWDALEDERRVAATTILTLSLTLGLGAAYLGFLLTS